MYSNSISELVQLHTLLHSQVLAVIMHDTELSACFSDTKSCIKSAQNPSGLPIWKLFAFHFWMDAPHPLGEKWTLSPEDYKSENPNNQGNTYLGYSVEPSCTTQDFIPHVDRPRGRAYVMAKQLSYFAPQPDRAWPVHFYSEAKKKVQTPGGIHFIMGASNDTNYVKEQRLQIPEIPKDAIMNLGIMDQHRFTKEVANSRVLIGVGRPVLYVPFFECLDLRIKWPSTHQGSPL